jgi:hypothetical protein
MHDNGSVSVGNKINPFLTSIAAPYSHLVIACSSFAYLRKGRWRHEKYVAYMSRIDREYEGGPPYLVRPCHHLWDSAGSRVVAHKSAAVGDLTRTHGTQKCCPGRSDADARDNSLGQPP